MANTAPTHDELLELLRQDIASHDRLEDRRAAVETYALLVSTIIQFESAFEEAPDPLMSDSEIDRLYVVECSQ